MGKFKAIVWVMIGVGMVYVMLAIYINFLADITVSVNQALDVAHNMTQYEGTSSFLLSVPWILYAAPSVLGIILIVTILKRKEGNI